MSKKPEDSFNMIVISLLKKMNEELKQINESKFEDDVVTEFQEHQIIIPSDVYHEICTIIGSNRIDFMGIT